MPHAEQPTPVNPEAQILDQQGRAVGKVAMNHASNYKDVVHVRDFADSYAVALEHNFTGFEDALSLARQHNISNEAETALVDGLNKKADKYNKQTEIAANAENKRKAILWDSSEHVNENLPAYEQLAKELAEADGKKPVLELDPSDPKGFFDTVLEVQREGAKKDKETDGVGHAYRSMKKLENPVGSELLRQMDGIQETLKIRERKQQDPDYSLEEIPLRCSTGGVLRNFVEAVTIASKATGEPFDVNFRGFASYGHDRSRDIIAAITPDSNVDEVLDSFRSGEGLQQPDA